MRDSQIFPYEGLGRLRFSMIRSEARALLPVVPRTFQKGALDPTETDDYYELGMHLSYDAEDRLEFIETFPPCVPTFEGMTFTGLSLEVVVEAMKARGYEATLGENGECTFPQVGIALYLPDTVESVSVYQRGYYEKYAEAYRDYYSRLYPISG